MRVKRITFNPPFWGLRAGAGMRLGSTKTRVIWAVAVAAVLVVSALVSLVWYQRVVEARGRSQCFERQQLVESAASLYVEKSPQYSMSDLDGPVDEHSPMMEWSLKNPTLAAIPRCPDRPREYYLLHDGTTGCPKHGHYR
ncbi:MAG: hypothetical protein Q7W30_02935 [Coriobacteriia bacterium]|nr:hypothetical protein [Coriobacteriia bacterium]